MAHEFKAGDLALVVGTRNAECADVIGKVVELVIFVKADQLVHFNGLKWRSNGVDAWIVAGDNLLTVYKCGEIRGSSHAMFDQKHLIPLRGEFEPEQQKAKESEPCA